MRIDALIIEGPEGFDPTAEIYGYPAIVRQINTIMLAKPYRLLISGDKSMIPIVKNCTRLGADFLYPLRGTVFENSLFFGLKYLQNKCDSVLIAPANYPFINTATYRQIMEADAEIAIAAHEGKRGWPVRIPATLINEVLELGSINELLKKYEGDVVVIETDDLGVVTDVCAKRFTAKLAQQLSENHSLHKIHPRINLSLSRENAYYGRGVQQILRLTEETGSTGEMCLMMGMAKTHAANILTRMRNEMDDSTAPTLHIPARGTVITPEGSEYYERFARWQAKCETFIQQTFDEEFGDFFE